MWTPGRPPSARPYLSGEIKKLGRVDHRDSFLDTHSLERERGITIFSKQARLELEHRLLTLMDTPGHADFAAEAERSMQVLDLGLLVLSASEPVQSHTETLWRLTESYRLPCFIFVTKMDLPNAGREEIIRQLQSRLSENCVDFGLEREQLMEHIALCDEGAMEEYLDSGEIGAKTIRELVAGRRLFPCFFGSGLKTQGVKELLEALDVYAPEKEYGEDFAAKVYKIGADPQGKRLSYVKITGGSLKVRSPIKYRDEKGNELEEKVNQIRLYSGTKYETADSVSAGQVCTSLRRSLFTVESIPFSFLAVAALFYAVAGNWCRTAHRFGKRRRIKRIRRFKKSSKNRYGNR